MTTKKTQLTEVKPQELKPIQDEATALISQAIDKKTDVATMEKLLAMRKDLRAEKAKEEYDKAMADFQAECPTIERKKQGYNYKYAPLESIVEQVKALLSKNGFSYTFDTDDVENAVIVYCKVKHIAGHMEVSKASIHRETTTKMNSSQQSGASMTYGKRYAFVNAFGILTGDEDTDASTPKESNTPQYAQKQTYVNPEPKFEYSTLSYHQQKMIFALLTEKGKSKASLDATIKNRFNKDSITKLTVDEANQIIELLKAPVVDTPKIEEPQIDIDEVSEKIEQEKLPEVSMG